MATININGNSGGGQPPRRPTYTGTVSDPNFITPEQRQQQYSAAQQAMQRSRERIERERQQAEAQQAQQINAATRANRQRQQQEDRMWQQQARQQRADQQQTQREMRERETDLRRQRATERERERQRAAFDRVQRRAEARDMERGRQEWALRRTFGNMAHRADPAMMNMTPAGFRSMQRQTEVFRERIAAFQNRWGRYPAYRGNAIYAGVGALEANMGSIGGTYGVQHISRLGFAGQRSADNRDFTELVRIERELRRLGRTAENQLRLARSPAEQATIQRQIAAINRAQGQIAEGRRGMGGRFYQGAGNALGLGRLMMGNPILSGIMGAATTAIGAPYVANQAYAGLIGMERPFLDFRIELARLGRQGGFGSRGLQDLIYNGMSDPTSLIPGNARTSRMRALGLGPQDVLHNINNFGVAPQSAEEAMQIAEQVRRGYLGNTGLSEQNIAQYLGQGRTLGSIEGGNQFTASSNRALNVLERVMTTATAAGLDRSGALRTIISLQSQGAGLTSAPGGMADFFTRMVSSGAPAMRSGAGIVSAAQQINAGVQQLGVGGNTAGNLVISSLFQKAGGAPKTEEALRQFIGVDKSTWSQNWVNTPAAQQALAGYLDAVKSGNMPLANTYLGQILAGHPEETTALYQRSPLLAGGAAYSGVATSNALGVPLATGMAITSTQPSNARGLPGANTAAVGLGIASRSMQDLKLSRGGAAGLAGALQGEGFTTGNEHGKPFGQGGFGIAQWTGVRRRQFEQWAQMKGLNPNDYETQQQFLETELQSDQYKDVLGVLQDPNTTPEQGADYVTRHFLKPANQDQQSAVRQRYAAQIGGNMGENQPISELGQLGEQQAAQLKAAEYVTQSFNALKFAGDEAANALMRLAKSAGAVAPSVGMFSGGDAYNFGLIGQGGAPSNQQMAPVK